MYHMLIQMKTIFLILLLVVFITTPSAAENCYGGRSTTFVKLCHSYEVTWKTKVRKILNVADVLDYHDPGPNPGHDPGPGKGKSGGKGINP